MQDKNSKVHEKREDNPSLSPAKPRSFQLMAKPGGPSCNLRCEYCFYTEKEALFPDDSKFRMSSEVLEAFVKKFIDASPGPEIQFIWQGGEPALMGIDFYRKALQLQKKYTTGAKQITNSIQTNGTLLDDPWGSFLAENNFLVGISLDGPRELHDLYRRDRGGDSTFDKVMNGLKLLQNHGVQYNVLACVNRESSRHPLDVYHFLKNEGVEFVQFIPVVERARDCKAMEQGLAMPPHIGKNEPVLSVTPWSVESEAFGDFLGSVFDEWVRNDVAKIFVMNFEWILAAWYGIPASNCMYGAQCGQCMVIEHNGDIYSCDHYVYPEYRLGNILNDSPAQLLNKKEQMDFGAAKEKLLPLECRECSFIYVCRGQCPRHRFLKTFDEEEGLNYLCRGLKKYYRHISRYMVNMVKLLENGLPVEYIMKAFKGPLFIPLDE
ncbi:MAG: anaerobic sulfatase maturase [Candidatus Eremiobacteraeota bacterium]|nr:anaerobic sulfatase maturase [Candidatus Eremiobacteraeota bacterium]